MPSQRPYRRPATLQDSLPGTSERRHVAWLLAGIVIGLLALGSLFWYLDGWYKKIGNLPAPEAAQQFDKTQFSLDDPASSWVVVNKQRPLSPKNYTPAVMRAPAMKLKGGENAESMQLHEAAARALETLDEAAHESGYQFILVSGYRSYDTQKIIYDSEVRGFGQTIADQESARPGHSEHQTGWAADLVGASGECEIEACFADTPEGQWLAANAHKYGFVIRYAQDKTDITGYVYEPWHLRYVGIDLAAEMHRTGLHTPEEFFDLPAAPTY
ncbi:MAG: M15 family metallopeptidase [Candidatus Saccharimonadales bacterium]